MYRSQLDEIRLFVRSKPTILTTLLDVQASDVVKVEHGPAAGAATTKVGLPGQFIALILIYLRNSIQFQSAQRRTFSILGSFVPIP